MITAAEYFIIYTTAIMKTLKHNSLLLLMENVLIVQIGNKTSHAAEKDNIQ